MTWTCMYCKRRIRSFAASCENGKVCYGQDCLEKMKDDIVRAARRFYLGALGGEDEK